MSDGIIRKKFNEAVKALGDSPEGKNTGRVLGALKAVTLALREEGFEATMVARHGGIGIHEAFGTDEDSDDIAANGSLVLSGEELPFRLLGSGYEAGDMTFTITRGGYNIFEFTSSWDDDAEKWEDQFEDDEDEDDYDDDDRPKRKKKSPTLEGRIADALIDVLAMIDFGQRHTVAADDGMEKTFKVPAQIKINAPPKGKP